MLNIASRNRKGLFLQELGLSCNGPVICQFHYNRLFIHFLLLEQFCMVTKKVKQKVVGWFFQLQCFLIQKVHVFFPLCYGDVSTSGTVFLKTIYYGTLLECLCGFKDWRHYFMGSNSNLDMRIGSQTVKDQERILYSFNCKLLHYPRNFPCFTEGC